MGQQKNTNLKAYVRFDGTGRIVPSSLILQRFKPKDGNWQQINATQCCSDISTTTTTTTVAPTTTTTTTVEPTTTTTTTLEPTTTTTTTTAAPGAPGNYLVDAFQLTAGVCALTPIISNYAITTPSSVVVGKWYTDPAGPGGGVAVHILSTNGTVGTNVASLINQRDTCNL